ncbi:MAG: asparagine synthase (glutamine-hydrolyzing) [Candidatus Kapabacteria bacterium]|nr:asparagine synthase (glutamine-hydrolyzing) [Candidatus Kapabacteria bacterium]MDW8012230.1 asparagine synthase (glutamine-hydrolyzing) [Bacteroidota bacterium]
MCGIAGLWRREGPVDLAELHSLCAALHHRGPDGGSVWLHPSRRLGFAHRRLAIIDLSAAGAQPMQSPTGRSCIVFNGEIYNYRELRQQACRSGWRFRSESDTEVILALYEQQGISCVHRLRGMFAFALWDEEEQRLWLVRDRLGIKPLYYAWDGTCCAFASELRALQCLRTFPDRLDVTALWDFLTYHYIPPPKTIYQHVQKLEAGTWLCVDVQRGVVSRQRYWTLPEVAEEPCTAEQAMAELDALLDSVVAEHLVADVPVGAFLSGGVDSSLVLAYARRHQPLRAFTVDFDVAAKSERQYAEAVARHWGLAHRLIRLSAEDFFPSVEQFVQVYGEPFGDASGIAVMAISRAARAELKAVLSGDGGDELFGGYIRSRADVGETNYPVLPSRWVTGLLRWLPSHRGEQWLRRLLPPAEYILRSSVWMEFGQKRRIFAPAVATLLPSDYDELWFLRQFRRQGVPAVRQRLLLELQTWLPEKMLTKVDRASMAYGLEVRVPLVDHRLVEWACRLPVDLLWHPLHGGKWLAKRLLARELPAELVYRPKKGFSLPLREWLQRVNWQHRLQESRFWREQIFHPAMFRKADLRSPVTAFLLVVLGVWSDVNPWSL